jgi:hypothetical protein
MFEKEELVLLHKALSELVIKGSDAAQVASLLGKVITLHGVDPKPAKPSTPKSGK